MTAWKQEDLEERKELFSLSSGALNLPEYGVITEAKQVPTEDSQGSFVVKVRFDRDLGTFWMGLAYPVDVISLIFGDEASLVGRRCRVEFYGSRPQDGLVFIVHDKNFRGNLDKAKKVRYFGGTLCPAGS